LSGGSFKSGFLGSAVSYGASWSGAYEAAGVSSQANTWAQRAQNVIASYVVGGNIPCFKSPLLPIMPNKNPAA
jgi:tetrahydromethanopterin S-methyltransferase subunit D